MLCKTSIIFSLLIILLLILSGCRDVTRDPDAYIIEGTMYFRSIEGGCWQFVDGNNQGYQIVGENVEEINIDGLYAKLIVRDYPNQTSVCMIGKIVELIEIIEIKQP